MNNWNKVKEVLESDANLLSIVKELCEEKEKKSEIEKLISSNDLFTETAAMLSLTANIYSLAIVTSCARRHKEKVEKADLIFEQCPEHGCESGVIKKVISGAAVAEVLLDNAELIDRSDEFKEDPDSLQYLALSMIKQSTNTWIYDFDDKFARELVFGITVREDKKRVTVVFRGSSNKYDWLVNFNAGLNGMKPPHFLRENGWTEPVRVHSGFKGYLITDEVERLRSKTDRDELLKKMEERGLKAKYNQILKNLKDVYNFKDESGKKKFAGYSLYVTGHSLGGALATLLAFKLAASKVVEEEIQPKYPIVCASVASPYVGDRSFTDAFQFLEKNNRLRHIRMSNNNDIVPVLPPGYWPHVKWFGQIPLPRISFFLRVIPIWRWSGYQHCGINVHLLEGEGRLEIQYRKTRWFITQTYYYLWPINLLRLVKRHMPPDHWRRMIQDKEIFEIHDIESLYEEFVVKGENGKLETTDAPLLSKND